MRRLQTLLLACTLLLPAAALAGVEAKHRIGTSVAPLGWLIERIGGEQFEVQVMIPSGASPETYSPRPHSLARLEGAEVYFSVGHPHFPFERNHLREALARMEVVDLNAASGGGADASDLALDPHIWLSPRRFSRMADAVAETLAQLDPDRAALVHERKRALQVQIDALDRSTRERFAALSVAPRIFVLHPAWGWYAADYGIEQIAIERDGKPPGPRTLIPLIEEARRYGAQRIYVQPGISDKSARLVAKEVGAEVMAVDPLARNWLENLDRVGVLFSGGDALAAVVDDAR
jgi:zinc transport system substrate-binding protein